MQMTKEEFIKRIRIVVYDASVEGIPSLVEKPPGRRPHEGLIRLSQWFNQLSPQDKECVRGVIQLGVHAGVFGMLTVLDGVRPVRDVGEDVGTFELRYTTPQESVLLNPATGEFLHDLFNAEVPPE